MKDMFHLRPFQNEKGYRKIWVKSYSFCHIKYVTFNLQLLMVCVT